jgi:hypothetical protein
LRGKFSLLLLGLAPCFCRGLTRRFTLGARLLLALLGGSLQDIDALLGIQCKRSIRKAPDESLQHRDLGRVLDLVPLDRFPRRRLAPRRRLLRRQRGNRHIRRSLLRVQLLSIRALASSA